MASLLSAVVVKDLSVTSFSLPTFLPHNHNLDLQTNLFLQTQITLQNSFKDSSILSIVYCIQSNLHDLAPPLLLSFPQVKLWCRTFAAEINANTQARAETTPRLAIFFTTHRIQRDCLVSSISDVWAMARSPVRVDCRQSSEESRNQ